MCCPIAPRLIHLRPITHVLATGTNSSTLSSHLQGLGPMSLEMNSPTSAVLGNSWKQPPLHGILAPGTSMHWPAD